MMTENLKSLIDYRLQQSDESIRDAEILLENNASLRSIANRIYYGMFYSALALLTTKKIGTSKHSGVISMFHKEYVKTKIFSVGMGKDLWDAFNMRLKGAKK